VKKREEEEEKEEKGDQYAHTVNIKGGISSKTILKYITRECQIMRMARSFES